MVTRKNNIPYIQPYIYIYNDGWTTRRCLLPAAAIPSAEDGAGDWMLRAVIRLPADAHVTWGGSVVMTAAWESFITSRQEGEDTKNNHKA